MDIMAGSFFSWFGKRQIFGFAGDIYAHFGVGFLFAFLTLFWRAWNPVKSLLVLLIIGIAKELIFDQSAVGYNHLYSEFPKDIFFSLIGFGLGWLISVYTRTFREKHAKR